ncbi:glycosyltransferase family 2 protein [Vulcanococcus limneticus]|uniref:glycosyltransferase family 2 protein n=1 Tax=Vulcanococcus limneticus TaxID=2170428 RepID=UPI00398BD9DE
MILDSNTMQSVEQKHPLVTVAMLAYQQKNIVASAAESVLDLEYPELDIIFLDDGSTDGTGDLLKMLAASELAGRPGIRRVKVIADGVNAGIAAQAAKAAAAACGRLIVFCSGDDVQFPRRVDRIVQHWKSLGYPAHTAFHSSYQWMDSPASRRQDACSVRGRLQPELFIARHLHVNGCTSAYTIDLFRDFPSLIPGGMREDSVVPLRALLMGGSIEYLDEPLALLRPGGVSSPLPGKQSSDVVLRRKLWDVVAMIQNLSDCFVAPTLSVRRRSALVALCCLMLFDCFEFDWLRDLEVPWLIKWFLLVSFAPVLLQAKLIKRVLMRTYFLAGRSFA